MASSVQDANNRKLLQRKNKQLSDERAMDIMKQHPQRYEQNPQLFDANEETFAELRGSGINDAGLARVIGKGRAGGKRHKKEEMEEEEVLVEGGARKQGMELAKHLEELHGGAFMKEFIEGLSGSGKGMSSTTAMRRNAVVSGVEPSGSTVPKGALAPLAMGNAPQAPASFKRNSVGMGKGEMYGSGDLHIVHKVHKGKGRAGGAKKMMLGEDGKGQMMKGGKMSRAERGKKVSELMKKHGVSLGEASKMLKDM